MAAAVALAFCALSCATTAPDDSLVITYRGVHYAPLQNLRPDWTDNPLPVEGLLVYDDGRVAFEQKLTRAGVYTGWHRYVADGENAYDINLRSNQYRPASVSTARRRAMLLLPHLLLKSAADADLTIETDPDTGAVIRVEIPATLPLLGARIWQYEYEGYRRRNGRLLPTRRTTRLSGQITERITLEYPKRPAVSGDFAIPANAIVVDAGAQRAKYEQRVRNLGGNAYAIENIAGTDSTVIAVAFEDFIAVVGTPQGATDAVLKAIDGLKLAKPIRYAIPTHHHSDHAGGAPAYVEHGATVLTTPGNASMFTRVETMRGQRHVLRDSSAHLELYDIGPTPHADEMLVAWLPASRVLYQSDLLEIDDQDPIDADTANEVTETFLDRVRSLQLPIETIIGAEGRAAMMEELERAVALRRASSKR